MRYPWDIFAKEKLTKIFVEKKEIVDIGGGLRVDADKNNRFDPANMWIRPYLNKVHYQVLDRVPDYKPDIIGDVHNLPFADNSIDAIICIAVLEHVKEPQKAVQEIYRVLKPGGYCFLYVPFLFYYHPMEEYYKDFYRFTYDGVKYLTKDFDYVEIQNVRGPFATIANLFPLFSKRTALFNWLDKLFNKLSSKQTSGYNVFCIK